MIVDLTTLNIISFFLIFFIGLPHGSFDGAVASLVGFKSKIQFLQFLFFYLALFFLVILFWLYFPIIALIIFILMTIIHFGLCDWTNFEINKFKYSVSFTYGINLCDGYNRLLLLASRVSSTFRGSALREQYLHLFSEKSAQKI